MMTKGLVGCAGHVADSRESYKQHKNRHLSSGKIICRNSFCRSVVIELCEEEMILLTPPINI